MINVTPLLATASCHFRLRTLEAMAVKFIAFVDMGDLELG